MSEWLRRLITNNSYYANNGTKIKINQVLSFSSLLTVSLVVYISTIDLVLIYFKTNRYLMWRTYYMFYYSAAISSYLYKSFVDNAFASLLPINY